MMIGNTEIRTPDEDEMGYELNWRWRMANALADMTNVGGQPQSVQDPDVRKLVRHLTQAPHRKLDAVTRVLRWNGTGTGALVEAFLIAAETCEEAAAELGVDVRDVILYSCLFFDIRDDSGALRQTVMLRLKSELLGAEINDAAARLRNVALTGGIFGLRRFLCVEQQHAAAGEPSLDDMVEAELKRRLVAGDMRTGDLTRLQANAIARERLRREADGGRGPQLVESLKVVKFVLGLTAPQMVQPDSDHNRERATSQAIQERFRVQKNVSATDIVDDPVKGMEALNRMISGNFKNDKDE